MAEDMKIVEVMRIGAIFCKKFLSKTTNGLKAEPGHYPVQDSLSGIGTDPRKKDDFLKTIPFPECNGILQQVEDQTWNNRIFLLPSDCFDKNPVHQTYS